MRGIVVAEPERERLFPVVRGKFLVQQRVATLVELDGGCDVPHIAVADRGAVLTEVHPGRTAVCRQLEVGLECGIIKHGVHRWKNL